jgi:hypothetical protein
MPTSVIFSCGRRTQSNVPVLLLLLLLVAGDDYSSHHHQRCQGAPTDANGNALVF